MPPKTIWPDETLNPEDSRNIIESYIRRVPTCSHPDLAELEFAGSFYDFAFWHVTEGIEDLVPELVRTSLARLWAVVEDPRPLRETMLILPIFATTVFRWGDFLRDEFKSQVYKDAIARVFFEQDIISLIARLILLASTQEAGYPPTSLLLDAAGGNWSIMCGEILSFIKEEEGPIFLPSGLFGEFIPVILKAFIHQHMLLREYQHKSPMEEHVEVCVMSLYELNKAIGWDDIIFSPVQCSYPRCAEAIMVEGSQLLCSRCMLATYCSARCQKMHFLLDTSDSHRLVCSAALVDET